MIDQSAADPITERLIAELRARSARGVQKYGVTLDAAKLTPAEILQHAKEEALDLAAYLEKLIGQPSAANRIAAAPRAWGVELGNDLLHPNDIFSSELDALRHANQFRKSRVIPIALVPLTEKEVSQ